jgi:peroxiredoxin
MDSSAILRSVLDHKIDTLHVPTSSDNSWCIMTGKKNNAQVFIVDENNNKDFRDDSVRTYQKMDWHSTANLIRCKYKVFDGQKTIEDSSWVNIGTLNNDNLWRFVSHHVQSQFSIDDSTFQIGVSSSHSLVTFDEPLLALISKNGVNKDTLLMADIVSKGEYLKLNNQYYRFADISNEGKYVTLIKEKDFDKKVGIQVGMLAPEVKFKSIKGELKSSSDFRDKPLLMANYSGCTHESYEKYKQLLKSHGQEMNIIGIESGIKTDLGGILIDVEDKYNLDIYNKYRQAYSSYTCYLISTEGRIINKFDIFDWESNLPTNYYTRNDGSALKTGEEVRLEYKHTCELQKYLQGTNFKPVIYHKEFRKDSVINYYNFFSESGDTIVLPEFKFIYRQDPVFMFLNKKLPDFVLKDSKGIEFKSSQLMGKPTLLNFSGTYCRACVTEIPNLNQLKRIYGDKVNFISIADVERKPGGLKSYLRMYTSFQYRILENTLENKKAMNIPRLPSNIFLDKDGIVRNIQKSCFYDSSDAKDNYFMKIIDELLGSGK